MTSPSAGPKRILIVDDSVEYLNFMQLLLGSEGFQADIAVSTGEMREYLRNHAPDLVISDVRIPGQDAFAVLDILQADEQTRTIPVLLCTGAVQDVEARSERLRACGTPVLLKPFDIDELLRCVMRLCSITDGVQP